MIPIIINNRNLLTWPKAMLEKIKTLNNVGDIFIIDNDSSYEPLLQWYKTNPCEIIKINNTGHTAPWDCGLVSKLNSTFYVVTDPDLGIDNIPNDTLNVLADKLTTIPELEKIGLGLEWEYVPPESPYYSHLQTYEKTRWLNSKIVKDVYLDVHVDTTFALYTKKSYFVGGGSVKYPYTAKHYPWEFTHEQRKENVEFNYYIENASNSSSYKVYLGI